MDIAPLSLDLPAAPAAAEPPYRLLRTLGEGGYGEVFEAWDVQLQRRVAIKRLKVARDTGRPHELLDEARAAASLRHPAFVRIHAFDTASQAIVMELVEGETLQRFIGGGPCAAAAALDIVAQVAGAMAQAHQSGLVHGDLKPSNLMREPGGSVRILDFGLALRIDPLATQSMATGRLHGTLAYLAPERLLGGAPAPASDIYALGVVLYELLTGSRPLAGLGGLALAAAQLQTSADHWPFPAGVAAHVAALVRAMAARDPAVRLPSMQAVCDAIRMLPGPAAPAAPRRAAGRRLRMAGRRVPAPRAVLAALLFTALGGIGSWQLSAYPLPPLSNAQAMQAGLAALRSADRDGSLATAIERFGAILRHDPQHAGAAAGLSLAYSLRYFGDGRDEVWLVRADASAQQALHADPQLALAHVARAWVLEYQGQSQRAIEQGQIALQLDPLDLFALWGRIDLLINLRRHAEARQALAAALVAHPQERLLHDLSGRLYFQQGDYRAAERAFRRSIALEPDMSYAYANLHAALLRQGRADEGLRILQQGLQVHPSSRLYSSLGAALFARGDYLGAQRNFALAVSADKGSPNKYLYWANLADALRWLPGRESDARGAYRQAVALLRPLLGRPGQDATYQSRMGLYLAKLDGAPASTRWTERALRMAPDSPDVQFRAGLTYEIAGNRAAALAHLGQAVALGYPAHLLATEPDLVALRRDIRYHQLQER